MPKKKPSGHDPIVVNPILAPEPDFDDSIAQNRAEIN
jgi:hypothetical protein